MHYTINQSISVSKFCNSCSLTRCAWLTHTDAAYTLRIDGTLLGTAGTQLAKLTTELGWTDALESNDLINTGSSIEALLRLATDGLVADLTMPSVKALARIRAIRIKAMSTI